MYGSAQQMLKPSISEVGYRDGYRHAVMEIVHNPEFLSDFLPVKNGPSKDCKMNHDVDSIFIPDSDLIAHNEGTVCPLTRCRFARTMLRRKLHEEQIGRLAQKEFRPRSKLLLLLSLHNMVKLGLQVAMGFAALENPWWTHCGDMMIRRRYLDQQNLGHTFPGLQVALWLSLRVNLPLNKCLNGDGRASMPCGGTFHSRHYSRMICNL